jgi:hypothetical protein
VPYVEVDLQPWKLRVRAVAPAAAAWRRLEIPGIRRRDFHARTVTLRWIFSRES